MPLFFFGMAWQKLSADSRSSTVILACVRLEIGSGVGIFWHGSLLLQDKISKGNNGFGHGRFIAPYLLLLLAGLPLIMFVVPENW